MGKFPNSRSLRPKVWNGAGWMGYEAAAASCNFDEFALLKIELDR
jgi:hypothetical protein